MQESEFNKLFKELYAPLVLNAFRITDDQLAAEDIAQEVFINLFRRHEQLSEIRSLKSYLYTATQNKSLTWVEKNRRENERNKVATDFKLEPERTALECMIYTETMAKITAAIDNLPKRMRQVFIMHYVEGKKITDIASEMKISVGAVATQKKRGITILQKLLGGMPIVLIVQILKS